MPFTPKFVDLVRNVTSVTGTGPVTLGQAVSGYTSLAAAVSPGDQFYYCIQSVDKPAEREIGRGTMQVDGKVTRQPVFGPLTEFTSGAKTIALVVAAEWFGKLDQLGGGMGAVASRAELSAREGTANGRAYLGEAGRAGSFIFEAANLSARVTADPSQAIFIAPASDPSGASGAWVRQFDGAVNVKWFGATGDGTTDDGPAFVAALDYLKAVSLPGFGYSRGSPTLFVPAGAYNLATTTIDLSHTLIIEGETSGDAGGGGTVLKWGPNTTGIRVQSGNTFGAAGTQANAGFSGAASLIRNLMLIGGHAGVDGEAHGIHLRARATIRDCYIEGFSGDGIHALCSSGAGGEFEGNANNSHADRVFIENCRNGVYLDGADVNAGNFIAINVKNARGWGIWDSSFLGNSYIGCHAAGCSLGPYKSDNPNARNVFVGCYSEGGQPTSSFVSPAIVIGGLHGAGIEGTGAVFGMADEGLAINTSNESHLGKVRASLATASGTIVEVHNSSPLSGGLEARQKFSVGFEADGITPCGLASIYSYPNTSDPALAEAKLMFATRTYGGGGAMTDNMVLDGANLALFPAANLGLSLGYPSLKWKELHIGSAGGVKVDGMKVVGAQGAAVPDASGGTTVDAEARAAINSLLAKCRAHGLIAA